MHAPFFAPTLLARTLAWLLALTLAGCAASSHHREGLQALERGDWVRAVTELKQASELAPGDVRYRQDWLRQREQVTRRLLAVADKANAEGRAPEAEAAYRDILAFDRHNARALAGLETQAEQARAAAWVAQAREALKQGDAAQAQTLADRALERAPQLAAAKALKQELEAAQARELLATPSLSALYRKPVNLEFRDASLKMVFDALSRTTGINFIFDRDVKPEQRTSVVVKQTTLEDAIDLLLSTNLLEKKVLNASSVLIYPNTPAKLKEYQDLVVRAFYLANVEAKTAAKMLQTVLKLKDVFTDEQAHLLVLRETPETIALAEKLIALQDLAPPEVMLEVEVLEVNRTRLLNLGVQLSNQLTVTPLSALSGGAGSGLRLSDLERLNSDRLGISLPSVTLNLQKLDGDANLLANPRLRVRDRERAKIMIGDKVPVVTTTTTPNGFQSESIQYLDVGLRLEVEPEIFLRDEIGLKLSLEVSSLVGSVKTGAGSQAYQIGTRNLSSVLRLKDGETQVLAGLISDADRSDANRIPLLGDLPLVGRLFSSQKDDRQKTEIVMSITPHLIRNIQRRGAAAETFWSGTEMQLRTTPLQLRSAVPSPIPSAAAKPAAAEAAATKPAAEAPAAPDSSGLQLLWKGPGQAKLGQVLTLELELASEHALRAAPLQLAFDPTQFEVVAVQAGDYFARAGAGIFNQVADPLSGRVSVNLATADGAGAKGRSALLKVQLRPLQAAAEAEFSVIGMTPIGSGQAVQRPLLPATHKISVEP